jgi:hypothetical protein
MRPAPAAGRAVMFTYIGLAVGDFASGWASQVMRSRTRVLRWFLTCTATCVAIYFLPWPRSLGAFYALCFALGVATGYWAVFVTVAAEQFGTNLRATATTTVPNFVRGAVVPLTSAFQALASVVGLTWSALLTGALTISLAYVAVSILDETHGRDLDFLEH